MSEMDGWLDKPVGVTEKGEGDTGGRRKEEGEVGREEGEKEEERKEAG